MSKFAVQVRTGREEGTDLSELAEEELARWSQLLIPTKLEM